MNNKKDRIEERVYSVTMTEDELRLFSEFLEQREFNSKAQKLRRRKWDIEQGLGSDKTSSFAPTSLTDRTMTGLEKKLQGEAISQAKQLGKEKTIDLLDKSTKNTKTSKDGFFKTRTTIATTRQELKEMEIDFRKENLKKLLKELDKPQTM